jgi:hypothetical protein
MKRKITFIVFAVCCFFAVKTSFAQKATVTLSPELYVPFNKGFNIGVGGILEGQWRVESKVGLTLASGIQTFFPENKHFDNYTFLPLKGGVKYHIDPKFAIGLNLGAAVGFNGYGTEFLFGGGADYSLTPKIDLGARIEDAGLSYLALRAGFKL